jgi:hypothetical protein
MLEAAYGADRQIERLLDVLPSNTIVLFMSDNGFLWGEHGLEGKLWSYDESIRVPIVFKALDGSLSPVASRDDLVLNVDLRESLTDAAGIAPLTSTEGKDWFTSGYSPRRVFPLEHYGLEVPLSYCGARESDWMYTHFADGSELFLRTSVDPGENDPLVRADAPAVYEQ